MRRILACAVLLVCVAGCGKSQYNPPKVEVTGHDTTEWSGITITYRHHSRERNNGPSYVNLNSPEDVAQYKAQVEFLLKQLEDAERKMAIRSDNE